MKDQTRTVKQLNTADPPQPVIDELAPECAWWDWSQPDLVRCKTRKPGHYAHPKFGAVCEDHRSEAAVQP